MGREKIGDADDLSPGDHIIVEVGNAEVAVFNVDGSYHALPNVCPHQYGPLCGDGLNEEGTLTGDPDGTLTWDYENEVVSCPWHNLEYHVPTGDCLSFADWDLEPFDVVDEDGVLYLDA